MSVSIGGGKGKNKGTSAIDNSSQQYIQRVRQAAMGAGMAGPSPLLTGASQYNSGLMNAGNLGMGALSGNQADASQLMNPYQQQVVDAMNKQWDQAGQMGQNAVADRATQAGAFGGTRQGVAQGVAQAQNDMNRNSQIGSLLYGGFNDAMNRAGTLAGYGLAGSNNNANLGFAGVGNPQQWLMQMLQQGYMGPMGGQQSGSGFNLGFTAGRS